MKCVVCNNPMYRAFVVPFGGKCGLGDVLYEKCGVCGVVRSRGHEEMSEDVFGALCKRAFAEYDEGKPGYMAETQRRAEACLSLLTQRPRWKRCLDYGCGEGRVADILADSGRVVLKYDPYMGYRLDVQAAQYDVLIAMSVVEHLRDSEAVEHFVRSARKAKVVIIQTETRWVWAKDGCVPAHCLLFTPVALSLLLARAGFYLQGQGINMTIWKNRERLCV